MPILATTSYNTCEDVLNLIRTILNDSEVAGGDVLTDTSPYTFTLLNAAYRRVQLELYSVGVETLIDYAWLIGLPTMPTIDPEARMVVNDQGVQITYPNNIGNSFFLTPQLPTNLVVPLKLWERQNNTTNFPVPMMQPNTGLFNMSQQTFLVDWEWVADGLMFRGALQSEDVKIKMEKALPLLAAPTDPVPIRGVVNAAAYYGATIFAESRGGAISPALKVNADAEIFLLKQQSARRRARKQVRRQPYSGRDRERQSPI
jgi:hypothetical protein